MFNFAARSVSEHTAKPIDGFKRGLGPVISILQNIKTYYRIKYYQKLSIVRCDHGNYKSRFDRPEPAQSWWLAWCSCHEGNCRTYQSSNYQLMTWLPKLGPRKIKVTKSHEVTIYICICTQVDMTAEMPRCVLEGSVLPSWWYFSLQPRFMASVRGPVSCCIPWSRPGQYTRYNLIKSHKCHQRVVFCWYWFSDLETHLHN